MLPEEICEGLPSAFAEYLKYARNLKFSQKPNYKYLRRIFRICMRKNKFKYDYLYDWKEPRIN